MPLMSIKVTKGREPELHQKQQFGAAADHRRIVAVAHEQLASLVGASDPV